MLNSTPFLFIQTTHKYKYINIAQNSAKSLNKLMPAKKDMSKKLVKALVIIIIVIALLLAIVYLFAEKPQTQYSDNPADWVKQGKIDVEQATKGTGYINEIGQQYRDLETSTVFETEGYYKGNQFFDEATVDGKTKMRITTDMKPNDGVIEGFMTERKDEKTDKWIVDIFVDEDWKKQVGQTNIYWGIMYVQEKQFVYNEISPGIYYDQIIDDSDRLLENARIRTYGIIVGDITKENTKGKTLMRLS